MFEPGGDSVWGRLMEYLDSTFRYVILNLAWLVLSMPFAIISFLAWINILGMKTYPWVLVSIPIVLASPALGGLFYATNQIAHGKDGSLSVFWEGVTTYIKPSYRWGFLNLFVAFMLSVNIWFYGNMDWAIAPYLRIAFMVLSFFWFTLQICTFPFLIEQEEPLLKTSLRNSFVATASFPLRSFGSAFLIVFIAWVSTQILPFLWFVISMSLIAYLSNRHTLSIIEKLRALEQKRADAEEAKVREDRR